MIEQIRKEEFEDRLQNYKYLKRQQLIEGKKKKKKIHVVYVMSNVNICGAAKIIFEHTNRLMDLSIDVSIVSYFPKPTWFLIKSNYIQVPATIKLSMGIPDCDIIIATYYTHIGECINTGIAPVVYFEQGDFHLFCNEKLDEKHKSFVNIQYKLPEFILTVSDQAAELIKKNYERKAYIIHNAIDHNIFYYKEEKVSNNYILMMGRDDLEFKGIRDIIAAYEILKKSYEDLSLYWITPYISDNNFKSKVSKLFINPSQYEIARLYREALLFVSGSHYESFSLPVLEAMACGCPVVTTDSIGIRDYVIDGENAMITERDPKTMSQKIMQLVNQNDLRKKLSINGLKSVEKFKWEKIIKDLGKYYTKIATCEVLENQVLDEWNIILQKNDFIDNSSYNKFIKFLKFTLADTVYVPVIYPMIEEIDIARWELVAHKKEKVENKNIQYCYCKVKGNIKNITKVCYKRAYMLFYDGKYNDALLLFLQFYNHEINMHTKLIYIRWVIFCLIRLKSYDEAIGYVKDVLEEYKDNADLYYVYCVILLNTGQYSNLSSIVDKIRVLSDGVIYEEYIVNVIDNVMKLIKGKRQKSYRLIYKNNNKEGKRLNMEEIYDFAEQLYGNQLYDEAINYYIEFIEEYEGDTEKIIAAYRKIYMSYFFKGDLKETRKNCFVIFEYSLPRAEECCYIGLTYLEEKRIEEAIFWYELAIKLTRPSDINCCFDEAAWTWRPHLQLCVCYYQKGHTEKAYKHNEIARGYDPQNEKILYNIEFFKTLGYDSSQVDESKWTDTHSS